MERHFEGELRALKRQILAMGGAVEQAIDAAVNALIARKPEDFAKVFELESTVNRSHIEIDRASVRLLAKHSPLAADLRLIVAIIKINTDLERMADQAVNICGNGKLYLQEPPLKLLVDIPRMSEQVRVMVRKALDAFLSHDLALAQEVLDLDDSVDSFKNQIFRDLLPEMMANPRSVERALDLILIARNLERIGDHATNIAEDVIFAANGEDVRHGGRRAGHPADIGKPPVETQL